MHARLYYSPSALRQRSKKRISRLVNGKRRENVEHGTRTETACCKVRLYQVPFHGRGTFHVCTSLSRVRVPGVLVTTRHLDNNCSCNRLRSPCSRSPSCRYGTAPGIHHRDERAVGHRKEDRRAVGLRWPPSWSGGLARDRPPHRSPLGVAAAALGRRAPIRGPTAQKG